MRKLIMVLALMFAIVAISEAQILTTNLPKGVSYVNVNTDYTLTNTTAAYWQINTQPEWYTGQTVIVNLDSLTGNHTNIAVNLWGRVSDQLDWTQIGSTVNYLGRTATHDTTITITNATEVLYRQYKLLITGTGTGTTKIDRMEFKFYNGTM